MPALVLRLCWIALLLAPNATTLALANTWDANRSLLGVAGVAFVFALYAILTPKVFLVVTFPLLVAGACVLAADWRAAVNLLELVSVAHSFKPDEVWNAVAPYVPAFALFVLLAVVCLVVLWRKDRRVPLPGRVRAALAGTALAAMLLIPAKILFAVWPLNLLEAIAQGSSLDVGIELSQVPTTRTSPRDRFRTWSASRPVTPAANETYVLVIGETIRSDRFPGCGGRPGITAVVRDAVVFCDVLAGAGNTHMAVPLLLSREMPGHAERVPADATFMRAFEQLGFETFWMAVQPKSIAWPDARNQWFHLEPGLDRDLLLPKLEEALARDEPRKLIVIHVYNAHSPYVDRYRHSTAPFKVDVGKAETDPTHRWNAYDNALDESVQFLNAVIERVKAERGESFVVYTPDHGENMEDDERRLRDHALKLPTLWDTRVPTVMWANESWRQSHQGKWDELRRNRESALMHMDIAPTLLGAAGIAYEEPRALPVDLTSKPVPPRQRITQVRSGQTVDVETLRREAGAAAKRMPWP